MFGPPDMPAPRLVALLDAFMATMKDPLLLAEAEKQKLEISPTHGSELGEIASSLHYTPIEVVALAQVPRKAKRN